MGAQITILPLNSSNTKNLQPQILYFDKKFPTRNFSDRLEFKGEQLFPLPGAAIIGRTGDASPEILLGGRKCKRPPEQLLLLVKN